MLRYLSKQNAIEFLRWRRLTREFDVTYREKRMSVCYYEGLWLWFS
jgi:hypothetical protein